MKNLSGFGLPFGFHKFAARWFFAAARHYSANAISLSCQSVKEYKYG
ncbi:MAG: hypothetical protein RL012_167 [Bacteroidota bacterium]|jgi:hypothetical protein